MQPTVRILMATYNGERFLREQLDSILRQSYENWTLFVQDDGSVDATWDILEEYAKRDGRITLQRSPECIHGAYPNFHSISNQHRRMQAYDYYMYADQDDIWDADKIEALVAFAEAQKAAGPLLCYSDMRVIDGEGKQTAKSIVQLQGVAFVNTPSLFLSHIIYGCSTLMNHDALMAVPEIDLNGPCIMTLSHDNFHGKYAALLGTLAFCPRKLMSYRRHGQNVTARQKYGYKPVRVLQRMLDLEQLSKDHTIVYNQSLVTIALMRRKTPLEPEQVRMLDEIENMIRKGGFTALRGIVRYRISWGNPVKNISRSLVLLLGNYRKYLWQE